MNQALEDLGEYIAGLIADDLDENRLSVCASAPHDEQYLLEDLPDQ